MSLPQANISDSPSVNADEVLKGIQIVDTDAHWTEPPDLWTRHAPAKFKDRMPQMRTVDGKSRWFVDGDIDFSGPGESVVDNNDVKAHGMFTYDSFEQMSLAASDAKARTKLMDEVGVWKQIVYPGAAGHGVSKFIDIQDEELRLQCIKVYNDAASAWQKESGNRLFPQALLPYWDGKLLAEEARRCVEDLHLTGFDMLDTPERLGFPGYADEYYAPFWEFCNARRVPIDLHIGAVGIQGQQLPWQSFGFETSLTIWSIMFYISNSAAISNFMLSGLFDKYPNLKVVSVESGIGWIPYLLEALEYQFDEMMPNEGKRLERRPIEYYKEHIYACFWFEKWGPKHHIETLGDHNLLFETDFPHPTCFYPSSRERAAEAMASIPYESRKRLLQDNALELYGLAD